MVLVVGKEGGSGRGVREMVVAEEKGEDSDKAAKGKGAVEVDGVRGDGSGAAEGIAGW